MDAAEPSSYSPSNQELQTPTTSLEPLGGDGDRQFHEGTNQHSVASVQGETAPTFQELTALISKQHHAAQVKTNGDEDDTDDESVNGEEQQQQQTDSDRLASARSSPVSNPLVESSAATVDTTSQKQAAASDVKLE